MGNECFAPGIGVYSLHEILFLRNVVREGVLDGHLDHRTTEEVARRVLEAYEHGVRQRNALLEIARYGLSLH